MGSCVSAALASARCASPAGRTSHSRDEALAAIKQGGVKPGEVVVLRGLGVIGGPGMAMTSAVVFALDGAGLINQVAMITEGQLSGLVNNGTVVGEASPEAAAGGPLAFVENGDVITIDVNRKVVDLDVPEAVLAERRKQPRVFGAQNERGWLGVYQRTVAPVHEGAVMARKRLLAARQDGAVGLEPPGVDAKQQAARTRHAKMQGTQREG